MDKRMSDLRPRQKKIDCSKITPEFISILECDLGPEDVMQLYLQPELPPIGGYEKIITASHENSRYAFGYPVSSPTTVNAAKVVIDIITRYACLPTVMITDRGSVFISNVIHEIADVPGITIRHATKKHAQTVGDLERTHAAIKTSLKISSGESRKQWQKSLPLAFLDLKKTYHTSIGFERSRTLKGCVPYNILDHKVGLKIETDLVPTIDLADDLLRRTKISDDKTIKNVMQAYIRYKNKLRQKRKIPYITRKSSLLRITTKNTSPRIKNTNSRLQMDWPFCIKKSTTQRELHSPKNLF